jgi:hypothetical protein
LSIDLDLFSTEKLNIAKLIDELSDTFGRSFEYTPGPDTVGIFCFINNIKVDIINYPHPLIQPVVSTDGVRMYHTDDIVAMKVSTVLGRGKKKDFWDVAELLHHYSIADMIELHGKKYPNHQLLISIPKALTYFQDAEDGEDPISLKGQTWEQVKETITLAVNRYLH